ncbi:MAG: hypothetical protein ACYCVH_14650 [Ignavibacteriaceae bacterium]
MIEKVDVHDLPEEHAKVIQRIADRMRENMKNLKTKVSLNEEKTQKSILTPHQSDVIGQFSRKDIYDEEFFSHRVPGH